MFGWAWLSCPYPQPLRDALGSVFIVFLSSRSHLLILQSLPHVTHMWPCGSTFLSCNKPQKLRLTLAEQEELRTRPVAFSRQVGETEAQNSSLNSEVMAGALLGRAEPHIPSLKVCLGPCEDGGTQLGSNGASLCLRGKSFVRSRAIWSNIFYTEPWCS